MKWWSRSAFLLLGLLIGSLLSDWMTTAPVSGGGSASMAEAGP